MHGATGYGRYKMGGLKDVVMGSCSLLGALRGDLAEAIPGGAVVSRDSWPVMAA